MNRSLLLQDAGKASGGAANEDLELGRVPEGEEWELTHIAVEDETTAFTSVRLGVRRGVAFIPLEEHVGGVAGELYTANRPFYLQAGNILVARFVGTTSGDLLRLYANGLAYHMG